MKSKRSLYSSHDVPRYFSTWKVEKGYFRPPSDKQLQAIDILIEKCKQYDVHYEGVLKIHDYKHSAGGAGEVIKTLSYKVYEASGTRPKYYVRCRNLKTGELKTFLSPSLNRAPKGYELLGVLGMKETDDVNN